ncbi:conserved hypothetical protein [Neospora caninum Liverpool]|uniref:Uncharacterized protein n=1 Tax=Neospora caninum (strain Liverpool) TaxID=572307 RepID=F0V7U2_NEOCL|nr:conserved hypothetical protein [Neospora caninum Liverpool]CBZ49783.1 conserved hypothetical protein [Neospora caninum Liverpool]CEL64371.1 TPA: hypothetical protein BN1204_002710 [Neospora caninum Liverpool]|eukprot:XP_003879818.1 conserved hypothetical protein [Neospora caninum Liverpool]
MKACSSATLCGLLLWAAASLSIVGCAEDSPVVVDGASTTAYENFLQELVSRKLRRGPRNRFLAYPSQFQGNSSSKEEADLVRLPGWALPGIVLDLLASYGIKKKHEIFLQLLGKMSSELDLFERELTAGDTTDCIPAALKRATQSLLMSHRLCPPTTQKDRDDTLYTETVLEVFGNYLDTVYADDILAVEERADISSPRTQSVEHRNPKKLGLWGDTSTDDCHAPEAPESRYYLRDSPHKGQTLAARETLAAVDKPPGHQAQPIAAEKEPTDAKRSTVFLNEPNTRYVQDGPRGSEVFLASAKDRSPVLSTHSSTQPHNGFRSSLPISSVDLPFSLLPQTIPNASSPLEFTITKEAATDAVAPLARAIVRNSLVPAASPLPHAAAEDVGIQSREPMGIGYDGHVLEKETGTPPNQYDTNKSVGSETMETIITESGGRQGGTATTVSPSSSAAPLQNSAPATVPEAVRSEVNDGKTLRIAAGTMASSSTISLQQRQSTHQAREQDHRTEGHAPEGLLIMQRTVPDSSSTQTQAFAIDNAIPLVLADSKISDHNMTSTERSSTSRPVSAPSPPLTQEKEPSASIGTQAVAGPSGSSAFQAASSQLPLPIIPTRQSVSTVSYNIPALRVLQTICKNNVVTCKRDFAQGVAELLEYGRNRLQKPDPSMDKVLESQDTPFTRTRGNQGSPRVAVVSATPSGRNTEISYSIEQDERLESARLLQKLWEEVNGCVENRSKPICSETQAGRMTASLGLRVSVLGIKKVDTN